MSCITGLGRSPGGENVNQLQYSLLENLMDRKAWRATVHGVGKNQTWLNDWARTIINRTRLQIPSIIIKLLNSLDKDWGSTLGNYIHKGVWEAGIGSSVQFSHSVMSNSLQLYGLQHARLPRPSPTPGVHSNLCSLSQWCHPTISSSLIPFSSWLQSFPASGSFPMSHFFPSDGQILEFQLQHQFFQLMFRIDFL